MHRARSAAVLAAGALVLASALVAPAASARPKFADGVSETYSNGVEGWRVFAPAAAFAPDGGYLLVWEAEKAGILGRRFGADGKAKGDVLSLAANELPASSPYLGPGKTHRMIDLVALGEDGYLLVWTEESLSLDVNVFKEVKNLVGSRIVSQRLDADGRAVSAPVFLGSGATAERAPDAALLDDGSVLVAWETLPLPKTAPDGTEGIWARRVSSKGTPEGEPFRVDDREKQAGIHPTVAPAGPHGFVVAWEGCCDGAGDTVVVARHLEPDLAPRGDDLTLAEPLGRSDAALALTAGDAGYLAAWTPLGSATVHGRQVDPEGRISGPRVTLSEHPVGIQWRLALVSDGHGRFLGAWESYGENDKPAIASRPLVLTVEEPEAQVAEGAQSPR